MKAQKLAWEQRYSDDSGVEYGVSYDVTKYSSNGGAGKIEFHCINSVDFPIEKLDWLIECLTRVKAELP